MKNKGKHSTCFHHSVSSCMSPHHAVIPRHWPCLASCMSWALEFLLQPRVQMSPLLRQTLGTPFRQRAHSTGFRPKLINSMLILTLARSFASLGLLQQSHVTTKAPCVHCHGGFFFTIIALLGKADVMFSIKSVLKWWLKWFSQTISNKAICFRALKALEAHSAVRPVFSPPYSMTFSNGPWLPYHLVTRIHDMILSQKKNLTYCISTVQWECSDYDVYMIPIAYLSIHVLFF